jgi:NADP-dependent 3-hydroxy acid dehydrogenase YdfG
MNLELKDKIAVVTGASAGLGKAKKCTAYFNVMFRRYK